MKVGVAETFDAAHAIPGHDKCGKVHGHTFRVEVEVEGEVIDGMVIDFFDLKKMLWEILENYDHRNLNEVIDNPTSENICIAVFEELERKLKESGKKVEIVKIRVYEKPDKWAEISIER